MVPMRAQIGGVSGRSFDSNSTFGQRRAPGNSSNGAKRSGGSRKSTTDPDMPMEISWVPSSSSGKDDLEHGGGRGKTPKGKGKDGVGRQKGLESFGAGLQRGIIEKEVADSDRQGRTHRRKGVRSGSKNVFRRV